MQDPKNYDFDSGIGGAFLGSDDTPSAVVMENRSENPRIDDSRELKSHLQDASKVHSDEQFDDEYHRLHKDLNDRFTDITKDARDVKNDIKDLGRSFVSEVKDRVNETESAEQPKEFSGEPLRELDDQESFEGKLGRLAGAAIEGAKALSREAHSAYQDPELREKAGNIFENLGNKVFAAGYSAFEATKDLAADAHSKINQKGYSEFGKEVGQNASEMGGMIADKSMEIVNEVKTKAEENGLADYAKELADRGASVLAQGISMLKGFVSELAEPPHRDLNDDFSANASENMVQEASKNTLTSSQEVQSKLD